MAKMDFEFNDEMVSSIIHIVGFIFSIVAITFLIVYSSLMNDAWKIVSFSIYGFTLLFLFLFSALYHGINHSPSLKEKLRTVDYIGIFLLIGGTFTPICLTILRGVFGWTIFGIIWFLAISGICIKLLKVPIWVTSPIYFVMGWLGLLIAFPIYHISVSAFYYLFAGGMFYSIGFLIFSMQKPTIVEGKFTFHEIWHVFILLGAISHYIMMFKCILGA